MNINLTEKGRALVAQKIAQSDLYLAWGTGVVDENTDTAKLTKLVNEISRRKVTIAGFANPNDKGEIEIATGESVERYKRSLEPTPFLYLRTNFSFTDDVTAKITELGLFADVQINESLPAGQEIFKFNQVSKKGSLLNYVRLEVPLVRSSDTRQIFEFMLPII